MRSREQVDMGHLFSWLVELHEIQQVDGKAARIKQAQRFPKRAVDRTGFEPVTKEL